MNTPFVQEILGITAVGLGLFGYAFYIRGIFLGKVKPHSFTWLVWGVLTATAFVAQVAKGGGAGSWVTGVTALFSFGFALVGLTKSSRVLIFKSDWIFFIATLLAIPVWFITGDPFLSVVIIAITDFLAFVPTIRKAFFHPETENGWAYFLAGVKFIISLLALESFTWTTALYPASLVVANFGFVLLLIWKRTHK